MGERLIQIYYGKGKGKTTAAIGQCIIAASKGQNVIIIQFLKGKEKEEFSFIEKLEPNIKLFRFDKALVGYADLNDEEKKEEKINILNSFNFARKVIETGESDVLVLDEVLGLIDFGIVLVQDIIDLISSKADYQRIILTGQNMPKELYDYADWISEIVPVKEPDN